MELLDAIAVAQRLYNRIDYRRADIERNEKYYGGDHPLVHATAEWKRHHGDRYKGFSDNWCSVVADAPADRTAVIGFQLPDQNGFTAEEKLLWSHWDFNDMEAQQSQGFLTTRIAKRTYVMVWADDEGNPVITWEHPSFVEVEYDSENPRLRRYGIRTWRDDTNEFLTLYVHGGEVWKLQRSVPRDNYSGSPVSEQDRLNLGGSTWTPRVIFGEAWPARNPIGVVPIVEIQNRPMLRAEPLSDIAGVVAMQDAITLLWAYLFVAADHASMPARVALGVEPPKIPILDNAGQVIGSRPAKMDDLANNRMLYLSGQGGSIAQWDAAKLDVFTNVIEIGVSHIASQTRTPSHYIVKATGAPMANAETVKMDEVPLAQKVRETHLHASPAIREVFRLVALVLNRKDLAEQCRRGTVNWKDPEIRSDAQMADAFQKDIASGFPFEYIAQKRYNLGPDEVAEVMAMKRREQQAAIGMGVGDYLDNGPDVEEGPDETDPELVESP